MFENYKKYNRFDNSSEVLADCFVNDERAAEIRVSNPFGNPRYTVALKPEVLYQAPIRIQWISDPTRVGGKCVHGHYDPYETGKAEYCGMCSDVPAQQIFNAKKKPGLNATAELAARFVIAHQEVTTAIAKNKKAISYLREDLLQEASMAQLKAEQAAANKNLAPYQTGGYVRVAVRNAITDALQKLSQPLPGAKLVQFPESNGRPAHKNWNVAVSSLDEPQTDTNGDTFTLLDRVPDTTIPNPEMTLMLTADRKEVLLYMKQIPYDQARVLVLRYFGDGRTTANAAQLLTRMGFATSESTVNRLELKALANLRSVMAAKVAA